MTDESVPAQAPSKTLSVPAVLVAGGCGLLSPVICLWSDHSNWWAAVLLALSTFLAFATWRLHSTRLISVVSVAALLTALFVALFNGPGADWQASLAFACAVIVIAITAALARTIVDQDAFRFGLDDAVNELGQRPHLMLWILFILFLQITYLLALAVGIHNNATGGRALIRTQDDSKYAAVGTRAPAIDEVRVLRYRAGCPSDLCTAKPAVNIALNQPVIDQLNKTTGDTARTPLVRTALSIDPETTPAPTYSDEDVRIITANAIALAGLRSKLQQTCQPADAARPCEIEILGHANDQLPELPAAQALEMNDDLADRRSEDARLLLRKLVGRIPIIWKIHSVGNNDTFLNSDRDAYQPNADHKLCVEVRFAQKASSRTPLALLDYLYFMIYTITTTGYGDLIPTDSFTQFVVSIANLYEMFFVVIVLNVLIKMPRKEGSDKQEVRKS